MNRSIQRKQPGILAAALLTALPLAGNADQAGGGNGQYTFAPPSVTKQAATHEATAEAPAAAPAPAATASTATAPAAAPRGYARQGQGYPGNRGYYRPPPRGYYNRGGAPWGGGGMPWGGGGMPWGGNGPWGGGGGPGNWFGGGNNGPWGGGPGAWMNPTNPKRSMTNAWDDMLNAPSRMGPMPGGWKAPSISVPNPVDVGDEFGRAASDLPSQMKNFHN